MSISEQIEYLKKLSNMVIYDSELGAHESEFQVAIGEAADTIEALSAKLADMERSVEDCGGGWKPISEYSREKYDWVLIKYFDGKEECVPQVAELRSDGKWHVSTDFDGDFVIPSWFDVRYFFDMQTISEPYHEP